MIYLASPWFKDNERVMYHQIINKMRSQGLDVYAPVEHEIENAWDLPNAVWGRKVFQADLEAIDKADEVWVLNFGMRLRIRKGKNCQTVGLWFRRM